MKTRLFIDPLMIFIYVVLITFGLFILNSTAPQLFPDYYFYIIGAILVLVLFLRVDFTTIKHLSKMLYILSIILLLTPFIIGQVTRGTIRWIPLGPISIQPSEVVRPFLFLFISSQYAMGVDSLIKHLNVLVYMILPVLLIFLQPSLGVAIITFLGFLAIFISSNTEKKVKASLMIIFLLSIPIVWLILAPYQKERLLSFINPNKDPLGSGYNSIQSQIAVGSGGFWGKGLGKGDQTSLSYLPERQTDFVFASVSEELGFVGAITIIVLLFLLVLQLIKVVENPQDLTARYYASAVVVVIVFESMIHIGMNMGIMPITGVPLPLISAGGSSLMGTTISIAIAAKAKREKA